MIKQKKTSIPGSHHNDKRSLSTQRLFAQGLALHQQGKTEEAQVFYERVLKQDPKHFDTLHFSGLVAFNTRHYPHAVELLKRAIEVKPDDASVYYHLGLVLQALKEPQMALECYGKAIEFNPDYAEAYAYCGNILHELKQFDMALECYEKAIALKPDYADAYSNCGNLLQELKEFNLALACYDKAIEINPVFADAYNNRGIALHELREFDGALESYDKAIALHPEYARAYNNRGLVLLELRQFEAALESCNKAIALDPAYAQAYNNQGNAFKELEQLDAALESYEKAIALDPGYAEAYNNRGNILNELEQFDAALESFDKAMDINPASPEVYNNRGNVLKELEEYEAALQNYDYAIALNPAYADAYSNRGLALQALKRFDEALESYDKAITLNPVSSDVYTNKGSVLHELQDYDAALENYGRAIDINPDSAEAYNNRATTLHNLQQFDAALQQYGQAISLNPEHVLSQWNMGLLRLLSGDFETGWEKYEWRMENREVGVFKAKRNFDKPRWMGHEPLQGKTILLYAEQGLGDTLQFFRYVKPVAEQGARVILEVQAALVNLLSGLEGVAHVIAQGDPLPDFDYQSPLLSLPLAFKTDLQTIPHAQSYLKSDPNKVAAWSSRLGAKTKPRIGMVWSGSLIHKNDKNRSIALSEMISLLSDDYEYICLQKEIRESDMAVLHAHPEIRDVSADLNDFTDTAALCELMDLVISVDTSVLHLAAGLGRPTWGLISFLPDWRWLLDRDDSPWYPSLTLYRQDIKGNWREVLERVKADLPQELSGKS